jgi:membrane-bound serine protease (ClpP class)
MLLVLALALLLALPSPWGMLAALVAGALGLVEVAYWHRRVRNQGVRAGADDPLGADGVVVNPLAPYGQVRVHGELWNAAGTSELPQGSRVRVVALRDLELEVEPEQGPKLNGRARWDS